MSQAPGEDNLWLKKGELATNAQLVERAAGLLAAMGVKLMGPQEVRDLLRAVGLPDAKAGMNVSA